VCSLSAKAIGQALDPQKETAGSPWLLWALLGLGKRMSVGDMKSLVDVSDGINDNAATIGKAAANMGKAMALSAAINHAADKLMAHNPAPALEALFLSLAPVAGAELNDTTKPASNAAKLYMGAAMARGGQRFETAKVSPKQVGEWLSDLMGTRQVAPPSKLKLTAVASAVQDALPFFMLVPAPAAKIVGGKLPSIAELVTPETNLKNLLNLSKDAMDKAPIKCVVALMAAVNFGWGVVCLSDYSTKSFVSLFGSTVGVGAAVGAVWQKVSEVNWEAAVASAGNKSPSARVALANALGLGAKTAMMQSAVAGLDVVVYGLDTLEAYRNGDFDTAGISAGLSVASGANLAIYVQTFRAVRAARAAVILGDAAAIGRGVSQAPHLAFKALGITILIVGGVFARLYTQDTPLEKWVKGTRFGIAPADWSSDYKNSMIEFYKIIFPISFDAYRLSELNPYKGMIETTYLLLRLPGKSVLADDMILFDGEEVWGGIFGYGGKREKVKWTGDSFDRHEGTRVATEAGVAIYRRVYHVDRDGRALKSINGTLHYSPLTGMTLPPIEIKELAWF